MYGQKFICGRVNRRAPSTNSDNTENKNFHRLNVVLLVIFHQMKFSVRRIQKVTASTIWVKLKSTFYFQVLDTWGKIPSGLLHGNIQNPGHFTECVELRHDDIQGQHCMTTVIATSNGSNSQSYWTNGGSIIRDNDLTPTFGVCVPASCSPAKVVAYSNKFLIEADLEAISSVCRTNNPVPFNTVDYFAM